MKNFVTKYEDTLNKIEHERYLANYFWNLANSTKKQKSIKDLLTRAQNHYTRALTLERRLNGT